MCRRALGCEWGGATHGPAYTLGAEDAAHTHTGDPAEKGERRRALPANSWLVRHLIPEGATASLHLSLPWRRLPTPRSAREGGGVTSGCHTRPTARESSLNFIAGSGGWGRGTYVDLRQERKRRIKKKVQSKLRRLANLCRGYYQSTNSIYLHDAKVTPLYLQTLHPRHPLQSPPAPHWPPCRKRCSVRPPPARSPWMPQAHHSDARQRTPGWARLLAPRLPMLRGGGGASSVH